MVVSKERHGPLQSRSIAQWTILAAMLLLMFGTNVSRAFLFPETKRPSMSRFASKSSNHRPTIQNISIEYCPGCRWTTKAFWMATEILQTCRHGQIGEVTVIPSASGIFSIAAKLYNCEDKTQLWDRTVDGGFPPMDLIEFQERLQNCLQDNACDVQDTTTITGTAYDTPNIPIYPQISIHYSKDHLLKAAYYGQELLTTFCDGELAAVSLQPTEGDFCIALYTHYSNGIGRTCPHDTFPEVKKLKQLVRDVVMPEKNLGHSDTKPEHEKPLTDGNCIPCNESKSNDASDETSDTGDSKISNSTDDDDSNSDDYLDDDQAEEARRYFGVM